MNSDSDVATPSLMVTLFLLVIALALVYLASRRKPGITVQELADAEQDWQTLREQNRERTREIWRQTRQ